MKEGKIGNLGSNIDVSVESSGDICLRLGF
jgi:hypothetical protein